MSLRFWLLCHLGGAHPLPLGSKSAPVAVCVKLVARHVPSVCPSKIWCCGWWVFRGTIARMRLKAWNRIVVVRGRRTQADDGVGHKQRREWLTHLQRLGSQLHAKSGAVNFIRTRWHWMSRVCWFRTKLKQLNVTPRWQRLVAIAQREFSLAQWTLPRCCSQAQSTCEGVVRLAGVLRCWRCVLLFADVCFGEWQQTNYKWLLDCKGNIFVWVMIFYEWWTLLQTLITIL